MTKKFAKNPNASVCENCRTARPTYDFVHSGSAGTGYREVCTRCFNAEIVRAHGLDHFENSQLEQMVMTDCAGVAHEFHFRTRSLGPFVCLEAFELKNAGPANYQFQINGSPEEDPLALRGRLIALMRRRLAIKHQQKSKPGLRIVNQTGCAHIHSEYANDASMPMLRTLEGRKFRLEIVNPGNEV